MKTANIGLDIFYMNIRFLKSDELCDGINELPFSFPLVILSKNGAERWGLASFFAKQHQNNSLLWYSNTDNNPTQESVCELLDFSRNHIVDGIIAIGGGSVIDLAKSFSAFHGMQGIDSPQSVLEAIVGKTYLANSHNAMQIVAVPTTAGTGSEVTEWATIWGTDGKSKYSIDAPWLKPDKAWIVPQLLSTLPQKLMLATGLDAVCHAVEAYWAKASNPISKALSIRSLDIMTRNLKSGLNNLRDELVIESLCTGSLLAGLAFSMTRTTACHSISYPLTYMFGMEHGFAAAVTLAQVAESNSAVCDISELLDLFARYNGIQNWLDDVCGGIVELRLSFFGIEKHDIATIASNCFTAGRMDNNPADLSMETVMEILESVY